MNISYNDILRFQSMRVGIENLEESIFRDFHKGKLTEEGFKNYIKKAKEILRDYENNI